jgi:hypothetical protein
MSLRLVVLASLVLACGSSSMKVKKGEPQTAREKMLAEQKANPEKDDDGGGKKWTGWRYDGDRKNCFFIVGRKCFKSEKAACAAAGCKAPAKCAADGAGPAKMKCEKPET